MKPRENNGKCRPNGGGTSSHRPTSSILEENQCSLHNQQVPQGTAAHLPQAGDCAKPAPPPLHGPPPLDALQSALAYPAQRPIELLLRLSYTSLSYASAQQHVLLQILPCKAQQQSTACTAKTQAQVRMLAAQAPPFQRPAMLGLVSTPTHTNATALRLTLAFLLGT
jgi:hypothetical protein